MAAQEAQAPAPSPQADAPDALGVTKRQRAGILITSIGVEAAAAVFRGLTQEEVEDLTTCISESSTVGPDVRNMVINEFVALLETGGAGGVGLDAARVLLVNALGKDRADEILDKIESSRLRGNYFEFMNMVDAQQIVTVLGQEQPQTIALVLAHLKPQRAAEILGILTPELQGSVVERIGTMDRISPEVISRVEETLHKQFAVGTTGRLKATGGVKAIADVLKHVDRGTEKNIFESMQTTNPELLDDVKRLMLVFEDLSGMSDSAMQNVLREVDMPDIALALKGTSEDMKELVFRNLSKRAAERLQEEMDFMGPRPRSEVDEAQQRVVAVVRRLEEEGKVSLGRGGAGEDELIE